MELPCSNKRHLSTKKIADKVQNDLCERLDVELIHLADSQDEVLPNGIYIIIPSKQDFMISQILQTAFNMLSIPADIDIEKDRGEIYNYLKTGVLYG